MGLIYFVHSAQQITLSTLHSRDEGISWQSYCILSARDTQTVTASDWMYSLYRFLTVFQADKC